MNQSTLIVLTANRAGRQDDFNLGYKRRSGHVRRFRPFENI